MWMLGAEWKDGEDMRFGVATEVHTHQLKRSEHKEIGVALLHTEQLLPPLQTLINSRRKNLFGAFVVVKDTLLSSEADLALDVADRDRSYIRRQTGFVAEGLAFEYLIAVGVDGESYGADLALGVPNMIFVLLDVVIN